MSAAPLTPSTTAARIWKLLRGIFGNELPVAIDLEVVRELLNQPAFGKGARLKKPMAFDAENFEGALVRNEDRHEEWGIFYKPRPKCPERERFTIAHEMGHFVLHREGRGRFQCDKAGITSGQDDGRDIEREANAFASQLLMPRDNLDRLLGEHREVTFHRLSEIARTFRVSFEALCLRFIEITDQRAILIRWDNGFLDYERRSSSARRTRAGYKIPGKTQEPVAGSIAADASVMQCFDGEMQSAALWCAEEAPYMKLREFKHTYTDRDRVISLLLLESAEPRAWDRSWQDGESFDSFDQFVSNGQLASGSYSVTQLSGSAEYFLFGGDGWCYCIVQTASTTYAPFLFGAITKTCTFTGGAFLSDTYSTYMRTDIDGNTNKWKVGTSGVDAVRAFCSGYARQLDSYAPIAFNGVTPLYPATIEVGRPTPSGFYSMMGYAPGARVLRMNGQYVNKDVVTLGGNDWMVFTMSYGG